MSERSSASQYVRFTEALRLFEPLDKNAFTYRVRKKEISTIKDRGKTLYSVKDTKAVRGHILGGVEPKEKINAVIDWLYPDDVLAGLALDKIVYNEELLTTASHYQSWRKKNPYISMAAYDEKDRKTCLGYIGLIPLPEQTILDILSGKREETTITPDDILTYDQPGGYTLLANSAAILPDRPDLLYKILYRIMDEWIQRYPERYVKKIYAQSVSTKGEILVQHFFMSPRYDLAYNAFELDIARPAASKVVKWFKNRLEEKAPLPPDLQYPLDIA